MQARASAVWLEIDRDCGAPMDELLRRMSKDALEGRYAAIVSTASEFIDPVLAAVDEGAIEIIVNPNESERIAALAIATSDRGLHGSVADAAKDRNADRLRQLSDEVSRIASTLARLSSGPTLQTVSIEGPGVEATAVSAETVRGVIRARRLRARYFSEELFADPAWDMLLDLLQAEIAQLRVPVSSLCIAAAVPATTALRWLKTLVANGLFIRRADPHDGRRVFVELAPEASQAMRRYFAEIGQVAAI